MASSPTPFQWEEPSVRTQRTQQGLELNSFSLGDLSQDIPNDTNQEMLQPTHGLDPRCNKPLGFSQLKFKPHKPFSGVFLPGEQGS